VQPGGAEHARGAGVVEGPLATQVGVVLLQQGRDHAADVVGSPRVGEPVARTIHPARREADARETPLLAALPVEVLDRPVDELADRASPMRRGEMVRALEPIPKPHHV
jgi:hypothetical protein